MSDFKAKMHQNRFRLRLRPRPRWGSLRRSPRPPAGSKGPTSKGRGYGKGGDEREGRQGRGRGGEGGEEGKGGHPNILLHPQFQFSSNMPAHDCIEHWTKEYKSNITRRTLTKTRGMCTLWRCRSTPSLPGITFQGFQLIVQVKWKRV